MCLDQIYSILWFWCLFSAATNAVKPIQDNAGLATAESTQELLSREKRTLLWPEGTGKGQIIVGFGVPVDLKVETVIFGNVFKANYVTPKNVSDLRAQFVTYERKRKRSTTTRWDIYKMFEQFLEMRGMGGKSCILQAVCEMAKMPVEKNYGIFNEFIHLFFSPTSTNEKPDRYSDNEYYAAQKLGKKREESCQELFPDCFVNLIELFTLHK